MAENTCKHKLDTSSRPNIKTQNRLSHTEQSFFFFLQLLAENTCQHKLDTRSTTAVWEGTHFTGGQARLVDKGAVVASPRGGRGPANGRHGGSTSARKRLGSQRWWSCKQTNTRTNTVYVTWQSQFDGKQRAPNKALPPHSSSTCDMHLSST